MKRGFTGVMHQRDGITNKEKRFCEEYIKDFNATRAGKEAGYSAKNEGSLRALMCQLKKKPLVKQYIAELQADLEELTGITRYKVLQEYAKIAFASFGDYFRGWMDMKAFSELTEMQKAAISEVQEVTKYDEEGNPVVGVRIKLHDKIRALDSISRMLGYDSPTKVDLTTLGKELLHAPQIHVHNVGPPLAEDEQDIKK